jgi:integrase
MASFRKRGRVWYYRFTDADGVKRSIKGCTDRRATEELARAAESEAARERAGVSDPFKVHRQRPIGEHVDDYLGFLGSKGNTAKHVDMTETRLRATLAGSGVERVGDLNAARVSGWLSNQRGAGLSAATSNYYLQAVSGFARWLVKHRRMPDNPLAPLAPISTKTDRRHDRGVLTADEFTALIRATRPAKAFRGLSGEGRSILYTVASYTGLRASELASLTPASFDLDSDQPTVRVQAAYTKNRNEAVLPLRPDLCELLRPFLAGRSADAPVWPGTWVERSARMLRNDLERAGVAYVDGEGRFRDFHSLRHRFGSELALANVPPKVAQTLMRHSTITLTLDRYSHVGLYDTAGALDRLPAIPGPSPQTEPTSIRATGTDGGHINDLVGHYLATGGEGNRGNVRDSDVMTELNPQMETGCNSLEMKGVEGLRGEVMGSVSSSGGGTRTPDTRIMIPLL